MFALLKFSTKDTIKLVCIVQHCTFSKSVQKSFYSTKKYKQISPQKLDKINKKIISRARHFWKLYQKRLNFSKLGYLVISKKQKDKTFPLKIKKISFFLSKRLCTVSKQKRRYLTYYLFAMRKSAAFYNTYVCLFGPSYVLNEKTLSRMKRLQKKNILYFRSFLSQGINLRFFQYIAYYFLGGTYKKKFSNFEINTELWEEVVPFSSFFKFSKVDSYLFYTSLVKSLSHNNFLSFMNSSAYILIQANKKKAKRKLKRRAYLKSFFFLLAYLLKKSKFGNVSTLSSKTIQLKNLKKQQFFIYLKAVNCLSFCVYTFQNFMSPSSSSVFFKVSSSNLIKKSFFYGPLNNLAFYLLQDSDYNSNYISNFYLLHRLSQEFSFLLLKRRLSFNISKIFSHSSLENQYSLLSLLGTNKHNFTKYASKTSSLFSFRLLRRKKSYFFEKIWKCYINYCITSDIASMNKNEFSKYTKLFAFLFTNFSEFDLDAIEREEEFEDIFNTISFPVEYKKFLFFMFNSGDNDVRRLLLNYLVCFNGVVRSVGKKKSSLKKSLFFMLSLQSLLLRQSQSIRPSIDSYNFSVSKKKSKLKYKIFISRYKSIVSLGKNSLSKKTLLKKSRFIFRTRNYLKAYFGKTALPYSYNNSFSFVKIKTRRHFFRYSIKTKALKVAAKTQKPLLRGFTPVYLSFFSRKVLRRKLRYKFKLEQLFNTDRNRKFLRFRFNKRLGLKKKKRIFSRLRKKFFLYRKRKYHFRYRWSIRRRFPVKLAVPKVKKIYYRFLCRVKKFPIRRKLVLTAGRKYVKNKKRFNSKKVLRFSKLNLVSFKPNWSNLHASVLLPRRISFRKDQKKKVVNHLRRPIFTSLLRYQKHFRSFFYNLSLSQLKSTVRRAVRLYGRNFYNFLLILERRLDNLLYRYNYVKNYEEASALVKSGVVSIDDVICLDTRKTVARNAVLQVLKPLTFIPLFNIHTISFAHLLFILGVVSDYKSLRLLLRNRRVKTYFLSSIVIPRYRESFLLGEKLLFSRKNRYFLFSKVKYSLLVTVHPQSTIKESTFKGSSLFFNSAIKKIVLLNTQFSRNNCTVSSISSGFLFKRIDRSASSYSMIGNFLSRTKDHSKAFSLVSILFFKKRYLKKTIHLDCRKLLFKILINSLNMRSVLYNKKFNFVNSLSSLVVYNSFLRKDTPYRHVLYRESNSVVGRTVNYRNPKAVELRYPFPVILYFIYYYFRRYS
jgi:ribosomal protein S4